MILLPKAAAAATIVRNVSTVAQLVQLFTDAAADPTNTYDGTLAAGTYSLTATLSLPKGNVVLRGGANLGAAASFVLDCQNSCHGGGAMGHVFRIVRAAGATSPSLVLWGVTVMRGSSSELSLRGGGGAWIENGYLEIHDSVIRDNKASQWGSGLLVGPGGHLVLRDSRVQNNENTQITSCGAGFTGVGGGVGVLPGGNAYIYSSSITGNKACRGAGIAAAGNDQAQSILYLNNVTVSSNLANSRGGGILIWGPMRQVEIGFSTIAHNRGGVVSDGQDPVHGGGIAFRGFSVLNPAITPPVRMYGTILAKNSLDVGGAPGADCHKDDASVLTSTQTAVGSNFIGKNGNCGTFLNWTSTTGGTTLVGTETSPLDPLIASTPTGGSGVPLVHVPFGNSPVISEFTAGNRARNLPVQICPLQDSTKANRGAGLVTPTHCDIGAYEASTCFQTSFQNVPLASGWTNNSFGGGTAQAALDCEGQVLLRGAIGTTTLNALAFSLPSGMWPSARVYVPIDLLSASKGRLVIDPNGLVIVEAEGSWSNVQFTSLEGVSFPVNGNGFTALALQNGWTNTPYSTRSPSVSTKGGIVRLQGAISGGTNMNPFVLPPGARPTTDTYINIDLCLATKGRLRIGSNGGVTIEPFGGQTSMAHCFTSLEGAWFALSTSGYTQLSLSNSWTHAPYSTRNARVSVERGIVRLQGAISTFLDNTNTTIFTLPDGAKPTTNIYVPVSLCNAAGGRLNIAANTGVVSVQAETWLTDATCFTSLEGVRFGR